MSLLGFDAIGRLAIGQNPIAKALPVVFGGSFGIWPPAKRPLNFAKDWIAFADNISVNAPRYTQPFSPFGPAAKPPHHAHDWIAFSGNAQIEAFPQIGIDFFQFRPPPAPPHFAKDWITQFGNISVDTPFFPKRDTHDGGHLRRYRHPPVYEQSYYDELKRKRRKEEPEDELEPIQRIVIPNLLIPLKGIIPAVQLPTLLMQPPPWPMPTLTNNPPPFRMATKEEMDEDDEFIIAMLLSED